MRDAIKAKWAAENTSYAIRRYLDDLGCLREKIAMMLDAKAKGDAISVECWRPIIERKVRAIKADHYKAGC